MKPAQAAHLSIVVLPFTNLSGDPSQDYFADRITENLTTELSRIKDTFVIARNTAFTYKGRSVDAKEIGKELGVRYVLEGSVQREQNRVRINAQLVDAESGAHLWVDRFEEDVADLFKLQDQVVARLANALGYELMRAEAERGPRSANPDAIDLSMHGWTLIWRGYQQPPNEREESNDEARALFDRALQIDPNNADSLAGSAYAYFLDYVYGWGDPKTDYEAKALGQADRAIDLTPDNVRGYLAKAAYLSVSRRFCEALGVAETGLAIDPNLVILLPSRIRANLSLGFYEHAEADAQLALAPPSSAYFTSRQARRNWASAMSTRPSTSFARESIWAFALTLSTPTYPPPMRTRARWRRPRPPWPKLAASMPNSPSNG